MTFKLFCVAALIAIELHELVGKLMSKKELRSL